MFDVWRRIDEKGAVAVPTGEASLSALGWENKECFRYEVKYADFCYAVGKAITPADQ